MTPPPGNSKDVIEVPDCTSAILQYEAKGFDKIAAEVTRAVKNASAWNATALWCRTPKNGSRLRGFKLSFESKNMCGETRSFEVLYTENNSKRNLIWLSDGSFSSQQLLEFKLDFGGGPC